MKNNLYNTLIDEKKFPYMGMSMDERNYYLNILRNCKELCDSRYCVSNQKKCEIIEMSLKRQGNHIKANGSLTIGSKIEHENRSICADIFIEKDRIIVDMLITRINKNIEYRILDEFKIKDDVLKRRSQYNFDMLNTYSSIDNEEMKGRLK